MPLSGLLVFAVAALPLAIASRENRSTTLFHAIVWAWLASAGWTVAFAIAGNAWRYLALVLTGCAGMAVFGARRPGVAAWNFVVVGLLVVLLLPLAEAAIRGIPLRLDSARAAFLVVLLGLTIVNYLPTRLGGGAALLGVGAARELQPFLSETGLAPLEFGGLPWTAWSIGLAPTAAWLGTVVVAGKTDGAARLWASFRDRFGLVWGLRLREQFNRAAANAELPIELGWAGLRSKAKVPGWTRDPASNAFEILAALVQRFGLP
jgi:hypothetical protein